MDRAQVLTSTPQEQEKPGLGVELAAKLFLALAALLLIGFWLSVGYIFVG